MFTRSTLTFVRGKSILTQSPLDFPSLLQRLPSCAKASEVVDNLRRYTAHCTDNKVPSTLSQKAQSSLFSEIPRNTMHDVIYAYCISARIIPDLHNLKSAEHERRFGCKTYSEVIRTKTTVSVILGYWTKLLDAHRLTTEETSDIPAELEAAALYALEHCIAQKKFTAAIRVFEDVHRHVMQRNEGKGRPFFDPFTNKSQLERHLVELVLGLMESGEKYSTVRRVADDFYFPLCDALMATADRPIVESTLTTVLLYLAGYGHNFQQIEGMWEAARLETQVDRSTLCVAVCRACELLRFDEMHENQFASLLRLIEEVYNYQMQSVTFDVHHERAVIAVVELLEQLVSHCLGYSRSTTSRPHELLSSSSGACGIANPLIIGRCLSFAAQIFLRHEYNTLFQRPYYASMVRILTTDPKRSANWTKIILLEMSRQGYRYLTFDERSTLITSTLLAFTWKLQSRFQKEAHHAKCFWELLNTQSSNEWTIYSSDHLDALLFDGSMVSGLSGGRIKEKKKSVDDVYRPAHGVDKNDPRLYALLVRFWLRASILLAVVTCVEQVKKASDAVGLHGRRFSEKCLRLLCKEITEQYPYLSSTVLRQAKTDSMPISTKTFEERRHLLVQGNVNVELASTLAARTGGMLTELEAQSTQFDYVPIAEEIVWCYRWVFSRFASDATQFDNSDASSATEDVRRIRIFQYYRVACALESQWNSNALKAYAHSLPVPSC